MQQRIINIETAKGFSPLGYTNCRACYAVF